jgi:hypothetical protein
MELEARLERVALQPSGEEEPQETVDAASQSNTKQDHFHHTPLLGDRYIRLLRIIEGDGECISITLHAFPLEQLPDYEALSYTWGKAISADDDDNNDPEIYYKILVNSEPLSITENLYDGLAELRKEAMGYLWVDGLCIDQTNVNERASQVPLMGDIYSSARRVIIWLGKAINEVDDVIWLLERYVPVVKEGHFPAEELNYDLLNFLNITADRWFELWRVYGTFFSSYRWFSRAWVVQELLLASDIIIRCGQKTLNWNSLQRLAQQGTECGTEYSVRSRKFVSLSALRTLLTDGVPAEDLLKAISLSTRAKTAEEQWYSWIMFLVDTIRSQNATSLHDKIYAIFGISLKSVPPSCRHANSLKANYEQSVEDTFSLFAAVLLENLPTLAILSYVSTLSGDGPKKHETLPSWCPDFSTVRPNTPLISLNQFTLDQTYAFAASRFLARDSGPCLVAGRTLSVSGKPVARLAKAWQATSPVFALDTAFDLPNGEGFFDSCRALEPTYSLTGQDRVEALWRTLLVDCDGILGPSGIVQRPTAETFSLAFAAFIAFRSAGALANLEGEEKDDFLKIIRMREDDFKSSIVELPTVSTIIKLAEDFENNELPSPSVQAVINSSNPFQLRAAQWVAGRRLFTTPQKWLGLGPESLKQDDEVWLLKYADVPFILRPHGESQYTLIGEAYVHGIMHGELIDAPGGTEGFREIQIV